ncbi:MAG: hypothetical protein JWP35_2347 [Caulobacter sp.]|nr:hypothetical protein [Caulobacter sp.]
MPARSRFSFQAKVFGAAALVVLADQLFWAHDKGWTVGLFAAAWAMTILATQPTVRRSRQAGAALAVTVFVALVQVDRPSLLGWLLICIALSFAVLVPRTGGFDDIWRWGQRIAFNAITAFTRPVRDMIRHHWVAARGRVRRRPWLPIVALPLLGGGLFLMLFASANPLIARALSNVEAPHIGGELFVRAGMAMLFLIAVWGLLRPKAPRRVFAIPSGAGTRPLPGVSVTSLTLSLVVFNALFALENGLDIAFLWSGARLPDEFTLAEYAHRGAYTLMAAALLTGLFVLVALRPGSEGARRPLVRWLVIAWIVQTVFLVASSIHRTQIYVDSYSLTRVRIFALVWMGLTAMGLGLILWRMLRGKSAAWLLNANALALGLVLVAAAAIDTGEAAASWNVRHAREAGGQGVELDLCYLIDLGPAALVPLTQLEARPLAPAFRGRIDWARQVALAEVERRQADWRGWTWVNANRLRSARAITTSAAWPKDAAPTAARCYVSNSD